MRNYNCCQEQTFQCAESHCIEGFEKKIDGWKRTIWSRERKVRVL
jgi:hypothetical protein